MMSLRRGIRDLEPEEVFMEFKKLYEGQIERIVLKSGDDSEVGALAHLVHELLEQNGAVVEVASHLEREARERVALMESRLKCSARSAAARVSMAPPPPLGDFGGAASVVESMKAEAEECGEHCRTPGLNKTNGALMQEIVEKDSVIARLESEVTLLARELSLCESANALSELGSCLTGGAGGDDDQDAVSATRHLEAKLARSVEESERKDRVIGELRDELSGSQRRVADLQRHISELQKVSMEARGVLTSEVAAKHDHVVALRGEVERLGEALRRAAMQARFKDDVIKEMRTEIRLLRAAAGQHLD